MKKAIKSLATLLGFIVIFIGYTNTCYALPKDIVIKILQGDKSNGKITLDQDPANARGSRKVTWIIDNPGANNVKTFRITTKSTSPESFSKKPPTTYSTTAEGKLKFHLLSDKYEYKIEWYDKEEGNYHIHDPKISIKPSITIFPEWLILLLLGLIPILLVGYAYKKLKAKRTL